MAEQTHSRVDLAIEQLEIALGLFLRRQSFVSALTLAGAAEEILGRALEHKGQQSSLDWKYENTAWWLSDLEGKPLEKREFIRRENLARNAGKHMHHATDSFITVDMEEAALWMLVRACENLKRLELPHTAKIISEFEGWFYEHVVGW